MHCRNCGTELLPGKQFCHACGARVALTCPKCGAGVEAGFRFCPDCGFEIAVRGAEPPRPANDALARLSRHMPEALAQKILGTRGAIEGERKQVTVMFCDLVGSTAVAGKLDPEVYHDLLEQYLALAFHEVYRFEGIVNQLAGDGLMALFGAPIAHEDAPQRAVHAALAIRDALEHFNRALERERGLTLPARIGIHTGPVVVGTVGNDLKMDYRAIGDTTNLAARLEGLAQPGTVLISETTARLVRGFFRTRPVGPLSVKGKSKPVQAYEVLDVSDAASPMAVAAARGLTPLVGREEELQQLEACFARAAGHFTQVVALIGGAGSGKSRLLYEFKERLARQPVVFFEGRCSALNQSVPFAPFISMLQRYFGLTPGEPAEVMCEKVTRKVRASTESLMASYPFLCALLSVPVETNRDLSPEEMKREALDAVAHLVMSESGRAPVVMIIEDLQWIDESSRELVEIAVSRLARARVMLLFSHRPDFRPAWRTAAAVTQLHLRPLLDEEVRQIMRQVACGVLPAELENLVLAKAEGSPFFAEEITRSLFEEGYLTWDDGVVRLARPVEEIRIPGTVQEVLAARLDRLGGPAKRVVQVASVFGRQFSRRQLQEMLKGESIDVDRELADLEQRGVIHRKTLFADDEFRFGESLTQEVAYESLLLKQRRHLHERIGTLLERRDGDGVSEQPALVAHHFARSDNREKAIETLLRAAADAERLPSYGTAIDFYRQAWETAEAAQRAEGEADDRRARWVVEAALGLSRVTVLYGRSEDAEARRAAERGCVLAERLGHNEALAGLSTFLGLMLTSDRERFGDGVALVEKGLAIAEQTGPDLLVASISRALAWNYLLDARFNPARDKMEWVVAELERRGQGARLTDLYLGARWMRDSTRYFSDDLEGALRGATESHALGLRAANRTVQSASAATLAHVHFARGKYAEAREWAERGVEIAEAIGSIGSLHRAAAMALAARVELGEPPNLGRYAEVIEQGLRAGGNMLLSVRPVVEALLALGDVQRAEQLARLAHERSAGRLRELLSLTALADVALRLGPAHWDEARRGYERAIALATAVGARSILAVASIGAAELALAQGKGEVAKDNLQQGLATCQALGLRRYEQRARCLLSDGTAAARGL